MHVNVKRLCERKPKLFLWDKRGYYIEGNCRRRMDDALAPKLDVVQHITSESLRNISNQITQPSQRAFLAEALSCYRVGAFRATMVMAWNLAFDHFQYWIISDAQRAADFNASLAIKFPKKSLVIKTVDQFEELKEFDVIGTAQHAKLISKNIAEIMRDKLKRRNSAAHPSNVTFTQAQADDTITDLIHNVIVRLS